MEDAFVNKVANSGIITLNLEDFFPKGERRYLDIKDTLFMGMVLKEKDFRDWAKKFHLGCIQGLLCSHSLFGRCHRTYLGIHVDRQ